MQLLLPFIGVLVGCATAAPSPQAVQASSTSTVQPQSTACGDIVDEADGQSYWLNASDAYACLTSVPFNAAVATQFIQYYNDTIQFQSTLAYLKSPPTGYQQPAVDLENGLRQIQDRIDQGYYMNEYAFEADLQRLINLAHDGHVNLFAGVMNVFTFGSPEDIVSVSVDGKKTPEVYLVQDLFGSYGQGWTPSPIATINGDDVVDYLTQFAALNSIGMVEPHADWNQLMESPALDIQGIYNTFSGTATFYPGADLKFILRNGTHLDTQWWALYNSPGDTGPLSTGGDFYNFFVLGFYPASYNATADDDEDDSDDGDDSSNSTVSYTSWYNISEAYPLHADLYQEDLAVEGAGVLTAYFLQEISTAVFSIPSFDEYGDSIGTFSNFTTDFIQKARAQGISKVVIDLQQNGGGDLELALDTFKQFFPAAEPFSGSRMRSHPSADILGEAMTEYWNDPTTDPYYYYALAADEWVITDRLNAETGQNFSSWQEFSGPREYNGDNFTLIQRYNLSSFIFDAEAFGGYIPYGYSINSVDPVPSPPFAAENIIILTDGQCSSTCAVFVEMLHHEQGVRTVVAGGRPATGPMQAVAGTRGARSYSADDLDAEIAFASAINETANATLPQNRFTDLEVDFAGFNLRDQIRPNGTVPLQFLYEAANCRIYYTIDNWYNYTRLWMDAANAVWNDTSLCVAGSTGYASSANSTTANEPPPAPAMPDIAHYVMAGLNNNPVINFNVEATGGLPDRTKGVAKRSSSSLQACTYQSDCSGSKCQSTTSTCSQNKHVKQSLCLPSCTTTVGGITSDDCPQGTQCHTSGTAATQKNKQGATIYVGYCYPNAKNPNIPCPNTALSQLEGLAPPGSFYKS